MTPFITLIATPIFKRFVPFGPFQGWHIYFQNRGELPAGLTFTASNSEHGQGRSTELADRFVKIWNTQVQAEWMVIAIQMMELMDQDHIGAARTMGHTTDTWVHNFYLNLLCPLIGALIQAGWDPTPKNIEQMIQGEQGETDDMMENFDPKAWQPLRGNLNLIFDVGAFPEGTDPSFVERSFQEFLEQEASTLREADQP